MRKIIFIILIFIFYAAVAMAQTEKGTCLLGGNLSFTASEGSNVFIAQPSVGVFIKDRIALGGELAIQSGDGYTIWAVGPYIKPYFLVTPRAGLFAKGSFLVGGEMEGGAHLGFGLGGGYASFLNKSIALEFGAAYTKMIEGGGVIQLVLGFQIHFKKETITE